MAYRFGPFLYEPLGRRLLRDGAEIRLTHKALAYMLGVRRAGYVKVPAQDHDNKAVPYARFQLYTWHERRPLAHWPGQGLGPTAHSLIRTPTLRRRHKPAKA